MDTCVFCGGDESAGPMNREHFVAKCFWASGRPLQTKVVPAHVACNSGLAAQSESFRDILVADGWNTHPEAVLLRQGALHRKMRKHTTSFLRSIRNIGLRRVRTKGGVYLGVQPTFQVSGGQIDPVLRHIARSCYYVIHGVPLPQDWEVGIVHERGVGTPEITAIVRGLGGWNTFGDDVFACRYGRTLNVCRKIFFRGLRRWEARITTDFHPHSSDSARTVANLSRYGRNGWMAYPRNHRRARGARSSSWKWTMGYRLIVTRASSTPGPIELSISWPSQSGGRRRRLPPRSSLSPGN